MARFRQPDEEPSYLVRAKHTAPQPTLPETQDPAKTYATSDDAPRPIGVDPSATGSFQRLDPGQGAVLTNRDSAAHAASNARSNFKKSGKRMKSSVRPKVKNHGRPQASKRLLIILGIVLGLVVIVACALAIMNIGKPAQDTTGITTEEQQVSTADAGVTSGNYTYDMVQRDGVYYLERKSADGASDTDLFSIEGTPVNLILYNGIFIIPENTANGWDVVAYMLGDGSIPTKVTQDGTEVGGSGSLESATLDGSNLVCTTSDGQTVTVALG